MIADRVASFERAFPVNRASWPRLVREQQRDVMYATWLIGNDYRNATKFYGSYPPGYLARVLALFPEVQAADVLHAFSGSLPAGGYTRLDINPALSPDVVGSVLDASAVLGGRRFELVLADPPYSSADAVEYATPMINRGRTLRALADVVRPGRHLVWLDTVWPMHSKRDWLTVGRITIIRSTNHRVRVATIFERAA
jgi:hypothetical protein